MIQLRRLITLALCCLLFIFYSGPKFAEAQQIDLTVLPPTMELLIKPGAQVQIPFTITNRSDVVSLVPLIKTFTILNDEKSVEYGSAEGLPIKMSFNDERSEPANGLTLNKGETKKLFLNLVVPSSTPEGDYYLAFLVETQPEYLDKQYSARIKTQVAAPLLVTVSQTGKTQAKGTIDIFEIGGNMFDSFDSIPVKLRVLNQGRNVVRAGGTITIRGSFGEKAVYPLYGRNILANSGRAMNSKLSQGEYAAVLKGFFIGRYSVTASVILADGTVQLNRSIHFFAFPFKIVALAVLGSVVGLLLLRRK